MPFSSLSSSQLILTLQDKSSETFSEESSLAFLQNLEVLGASFLSS